RFLCALIFFYFGPAAGIAQAAPPPPPPETLNEAIATASCGSKRVVTSPAQIPVGAVNLPPQSIGSSTGSLTWMWGVRISSRDPRVAGITGLEADRTFGLIATTARSDWLTLDIRRSGLAHLNAIGVAVMRGAPGAPAALANIGNWTFVSFPAQHVVSQYALSVCGVDANAVPWITTSGSVPASALVEAAYSYVGLAGYDGAEIADALLLPYSPQTVVLNQHDFPGVTGYRLMALTNPDKIVPNVIAVWRALDGRQTLVEQIHVSRWDDVRTGNEPAEVAILARLPLAVTGATSFHDSATGETHLILAADSAQSGSVEFYGFKFKN
ncbi:MAG: hypothetical protein ABSD74_09500, partial [Rhizomicrobium sp.]